MVTSLTLALQQERTLQLISEADEHISSALYHYGESKVGPEGDAIHAAAQALQCLSSAVASLDRRIHALESGEVQR